MQQTWESISRRRNKSRRSTESLITYLCITHVSPTGECKWHFHTWTTKVLTSQTEDYQSALSSNVLNCLPCIWEPLGKCQRRTERNPLIFCCSTCRREMHCLVQCHQPPSPLSVPLWTWRPGYPTVAARSGKAAATLFKCRESDHIYISETSCWLLGGDEFRENN